MPRFIHYYSNFRSGELTPRLLGWSDNDLYASGAKRLLNVTVRPHGGVARRMGTRYVSETKSSGAAILVPFSGAGQEGTVIELGNQYARFYTNGARIGSPYEITTPFTSANLSKLDWSQLSDTLAIVGEGYPQNLRRFQDTLWAIGNIKFSVEPYEEVGVLIPQTMVIAPDGATGSRTFTAGASFFLNADVGRLIVEENGPGVATITAYTSTTVVTATVESAFSAASFAVNLTRLKDTPGASCTPSAASPVGVACSLTLSTAGWRATDVTSHVRINGGTVLITGFSSTTVVTGVVEQVLSGTTAAQPGSWTLEQPVMNSTFGYPKSITLYEQRMILAGTTKRPQGIYASVSGEQTNYLKGLADGDGFIFDIYSDTRNEIQYVISGRHLLVLADSGEFSVFGGVEKPFAPTNLQVRNHSLYGCEKIRPVRIGVDTMFVQRGKTRVRAASYQFDQDAWRAPDASVRSEHLFRVGIVQLAYQQDPIPLVYALLADGTVACCTYDREEKLNAWTLWTTDGFIEWLCPIYNNSVNEMWAIIRRTINGSTKRYVEVFTDGLNLDCSLTLTGAASATWAGLDHLEAKSVQVIADGVYMGEFTVTGGSITLPRTATTVVIGLGYTSTVVPLTPNKQINGDTRSSLMRTDEVRILVESTVGLTVNGTDIPFRQLGQPTDTPIPTFSGWKTIDTAGWEKGGITLTLEQKLPMPFEILSVAMRMTVNE